MAVLRIVANIATPDLAAGEHFYGVILGLEKIMDHGWIVTYGNAMTSAVRISMAKEGGNGLPVPDPSIEVDDIDAVRARILAAGMSLDRDIQREPWGVRRLFLRDPYGRLVNILSHD